MVDVEKRFKTTDALNHHFITQNCETDQKVAEFATSNDTVFLTSENISFKKEGRFSKIKSWFKGIKKSELQ